MLTGVMAVSFAVLGCIGTRIYQEMPPIPDRVVTTKAVRKNYFSNLDDDDRAKWSSSNPARPSEA